MSSDREPNGPTQIHTQLNYNDLSTHIQLNGMNGLNGVGMMGKSFGKMKMTEIKLI
jgi:hypothetical protein